MAPVAARLESLEAAAPEATIETAMQRISTRIDEALNRQQEISDAVGEAVSVLAQRLDAMETAMLAELEDQALQSQHSLEQDGGARTPQRANGCMRMATSGPSRKTQPCAFRQKAPARSGLSRKNRPRRGAWTSQPCAPVWMQRPTRANQRRAILKARCRT